jgi:hypothetical protein
VAFAGAVTAVVVAGCGGQSAPAPAGAAGQPDEVVVQPDEIVAVTVDGAVVRVARDGSRRGLLGRLRLAVGAEVDAVDVSPDGTRVVVSVLNDHDEACDAAVHLYSADSDGAVLADGAAASYSPDGTRLLYVRYRASGEFCFRHEVVVRTIAGGVESAIDLPGGERVEGNPHEWPLAWSPDSEHFALVGRTGAFVSDLAGDDVRPLAGATAPVFLDDETLLAVTGCCVGPGHVTRFSLAGGDPPQPAFDVPTAVRSIKRERSGTGVWLTLEEGGLWHWDGTSVTQVAPGYLLASG